MLSALLQFVPATLVLLLNMNSLCLIEDYRIKIILEEVYQVFHPVEILDISHLIY